MSTQTAGSALTPARRVTFAPPPVELSAPGFRQSDRRSWIKIKRHRHFYFFVAPFFVLFGVFNLYPLVFSFYLSFVRWDGLTPMQWVGWSNFAIMLDDEILIESLWNTLIIGLLYVPPMLVLAFLFAVALNTSWLKARALFRTHGRNIDAPPWS